MVRRISVLFSLMAFPACAMDLGDESLGLDAGASDEGETLDDIEAPACSGVPVAAGSSIQAKVDANPTGTTFCLGAGTFRLTSPIRPKSGDRFIGTGPTTVLDGGSGASTSFAEITNNVQIRWLAIQNFSDKGLMLGSGWLGDHLEVRNNQVGVAMHGNAPVLQNSRLHHNGGPFTTGLSRSFGLTSNTATNGRVLFNEIDHNNPNCNRTGQNGGGAGANKFWASTGFLLEGNHWHDNFGHGIWLDGSNSNFTIRNERVVNNTNLCGGTTSKVSGAQGIRIEVSCRTTVEDTVVSGNAQGGIWINGSYGNIVRRNTVSAPQSATVVMWALDPHRDAPNGGRYLANCGGGVYKASDNTFTSNTVTFANNTQWVGTQAESGEDIRNNDFSANRYRAGSCSADHWKWQGVKKSWTDWRAIPQDAGGSCAP